MDKKEEIIYLLHFFSQPQAQQWKEIPDTLAPVWVRVGNMEAATDKPIRLLSMVLADHLNGCCDNFPPDAIEVTDEIRVLLTYWMLESPHDHIFAKRDESDQLDYIWGILSRLCQEALNKVEYPPVKDICFEHFVKNYSHPINTQEFDLPIL